MQRESILFLLIGILIGSLFMGATAGFWGRGWMMGANWHMMGDHEDNEISSGYMMRRLYNASGDQFDHGFLASMILHHQGAIDMAKAAKSNAKHQEIKDMAQSIIDEQAKEINQMRLWQDQWNYPTLPHMMRY